MNTLLPPLSVLLVTTGFVSVGIGLVFLARPFLRRTVGSRVVAALWLVLALRLLCPFSLAPRWQWRSPDASAQTGKSADGTAWSIHASVVNAGLAAEGRSSGEKLNREVAPSIWTRLRVWPGWPVVWLVGVGLSLANLARGAWRVRHWAARTRPGAEATALQTAFDACPEEDRQGVALRLTDDLSVPTLVGIMRPQLWFPRAWLDRLEPDELRHILLHELGHARRRDLLAQLLCSLACCLHWFNPLATLLARWARVDRELACDAWVLARISGDGWEPGLAHYGRTLLKVTAGLRANSFASIPSAAVAMATSRHHLALRVREIGSFRPLPRRGGTFLLAAVAASLAASLLAAPAPIVGPSATPTATPIAPVQVYIPASDTHPATPPAVVLEPTATPEPAATNSPAPTATPPEVSPAPRRGIEIESKFVEFSPEALRAFEKVRQKNLSQRLLAQTLSIIGSGKPAAGAEAPKAFPLMGVFKKEEFEELVRQMNTIKGVDLLSAPRVTTKSGQKATIEIIREMHYPVTFDHGHDASGKPVITPSHFEQKNTGLSLEVEPTLLEDTIIDLKLASQVVTFEGFLQGDGAPRATDESVDNTHPVFQTQKLETAVSVYPNSTVLLGKTVHQPGSWQALGKRDVSKEEGVVLVFVTARIVNFDGFPPPASSLPKPDPADTVSVPGGYGTPVPGKPGFVTSPYAPNSGYVDVTGYKHGDSVLDPYSGKFFLVP